MFQPQELLLLLQAIYGKDMAKMIGSRVYASGGFLLDIYVFTYFFSIWKVMEAA